MRFLRTRPVFAVVAALIALAVAASFAPFGSKASAAPGDIVLAFEGKVSKGPSKGAKLEGILTLTPGANGALSGGLDTGAGDPIPVSGTLGAGNVSVAFDLPGEAIVFGIGTPNTKGGFSGTFVGPATGDQGKWKSEPVVSVTLNFSGTVNEGPNAGVTLAGPLAITVNPLDDDKFTGTLTVAGIGALPVTGELNDNGRTLDITFDTGAIAAGSTIEGEGTRTSAGGYAGDFKGPGAGDEGTWTATP
ncbi:MAG: hypothetical protein H7Y32_05205 [Chloroflexales bacterium]|nr:hypothetical protein [Chloroflexales bacterium]